jgi:hypothetical protein
MELERYSFGVGDRFGYEGVAQLRALQKAAEKGVRIVPVWNKSNREHAIVGTEPESTRREADAAVRKAGWSDSYYVDADHITLANVNPYLSTSDYFTIDIADHIGKPAAGSVRASFLSSMKKYQGSHAIAGLQKPLEITDSALDHFAGTYLHGIVEAGKVYRHIAEKKGEDTFITEVSIDEARNPQTAIELLLILIGLADEGVPVQTLAPKFPGSFLKGVNYVGDAQQFAQRFAEYLAVIAGAVKSFDLPRNLKLSIHTGSDKFALYPLIYRAIRSIGAGVHLKTAGTTWLEELAGLARSGGSGLRFAQEIYRESYSQCEALCQPYLAIIDIDPQKLPTPELVASWSAEEFVNALQHEESCKSYNSHLRQLLHIGFKVAAEKKARFAELLAENRSVVERNVTQNLFDRHLKPLFGI